MTTLTKAYIQDMINLNDSWAQRALLAIYDRQTVAEQYMGHTVHTNHQGFSKFDASLLTSFAKQLRDKGWLSQKQMKIVRRRMQKYAGQLLIVASEQAASQS